MAANFQTDPSSLDMTMLPFAGMLQAAAELQRLQWEAAMAWYGAIADAQQEAWDEWVCRFAGGVPIDA